MKIAGGWRRVMEDVKKILFYERKQNMATAYDIQGFHYINVIHWGEKPL